MSVGFKRKVSRSAERTHAPVLYVLPSLFIHGRSLEVAGDTKAQFHQFPITPTRDDLLYTTIFANIKGFRGTFRETNQSPTA